VTRGRRHSLVPSRSDGSVSELGIPSAWARKQHKQGSLAAALSPWTGNPDHRPESLRPDLGVGPNLWAPRIPSASCVQAVLVNETTRLSVRATLPAEIVDTTTGRCLGQSGHVLDRSRATSVCSISGQTVSVNAPGRCIIDANQAAGNGYVAAPQAQQSFVVGEQDITFTSTPPLNAIVDRLTPFPQRVAPRAIRSRSRSIPRHFGLLDLRSDRELLRTGHVHHRRQPGRRQQLWAGRSGPAVLRRGGTAHQLHLVATPCF
jgi:hypothetical protein